jgi:hypothetical protein
MLVRITSKMSVTPPSSGRQDKPVRQVWHVEAYADGVVGYFNNRSPWTAGTGAEAVLKRQVPKTPRLPAHRLRRGRSYRHDKLGVLAFHAECPPVPASSGH